MERRLTRTLTSALGLLAVMALGACDSQPPKPIGAPPSQGGGGGVGNQPGQPTPGGIAASRVSKAGPGLAANAPELLGAGQVTVNLIPQMVALPTVQTAGVSSLRVAAVHDGTWVTLRLEWDDATANTTPGLDQFEDMVAIQLPVNPGSMPNPMMGDPANPVAILQWRAGMQAALDRGEPPATRHAYPNTYSDIDIANLVGGEAGNSYRGAASLGNPRSIPDMNAAPVVAHKAKGFGTLTAYPGRHAEGRGVHDGSKWVVLLHLPMNAPDPVVTSLKPGTGTVVSFAVWEGSRNETGGRKAWAPTWTALNLAP